MDNLDTYNRVPSLESATIKTSLLLTYCLLILIVISSISSLWLLNPNWPYAAHCAAAAILLYAIIVIVDKRRQRHCQFCGQALSTVVRPFLLTAQYLNMQGTKDGEYFITYAAKGTAPWAKRWVKISNQSSACHHCRLTEESYKVTYQAISPEELDKYQSKTDK